MLKKLRRLNRWDDEAAMRVMTLWYCASDPRAGRFSRWLSRAAVLYAYSPIGLIPDFIPFIGHLDDLLLVPAVARLVQRRVAAPVWQDANGRAREWVAARGPRAKPTGVRIALWAFFIAALLLLAAALFGMWVLYQVLLVPRESETNTTAKYPTR